MYRFAKECESMRWLGVAVIALLVAGCGASTTRGLRSDAGIASSTDIPGDFGSSADVDALRDGAVAADGAAPPPCGPATSPIEGGVCSIGSAPVPCDVDTGQSATGPDGICNLGQRNCVLSTTNPGESVWSSCLAWRAPFRYIGAVSVCPGSCLPGCLHQVDCPTAGDVLFTGSSNVTIGSLPAAVFCPACTGVGGVTSACSTSGAPSPGTTQCTTGTYVLTVNSNCPEGTAVNWGQFNYTSSVPAGTAITFVAHRADVLPGLATATPAPLPNAPPGDPQVPSSVDLLGNLLAWAPTEFLDRRQYLSITVTLDPSPDGTMAPTLGSTEVQFTCDPISVSPPVCVPGAPCYVGDPCRLGVIACANTDGGRVVETCIDNGPAPIGTVCGPGAVCSPTGGCVPCAAGESCDAGMISCGTGAPVCTAVDLDAAVADAGLSDIAGHD